MVHTLVAGTVIISLLAFVLIVLYGLMIIFFRRNDIKQLSKKKTEESEVQKSHQQSSAHQASFFG